jgi:hypothetical protein
LADLKTALQTKGVSSRPRKSDFQAADD